MWETARVAGFFAAHAVWGVSNGEVLIPMYGFQKPDGERGIDRFPGEMHAGAQGAQAALRDNPHGAAHGVTVLDAFIELPEGQTDALMLEAVGYDGDDFLLRMAVPYRPAAQGFAVFRPKFIEIQGAERDEYESIGEAFFTGADKHEKAAPIWAAAFDESR